MRCLVLFAFVSVCRCCMIVFVSCFFECGFCVCLCFFVQFHCVVSCCLGMCWACSGMRCVGLFSFGVRFFCGMLAIVYLVVCVCFFLPVLANSVVVACCFGFGLCCLLFWFVFFLSVLFLSHACFLCFVVCVCLFCFCSVPLCCYLLSRLGMCCVCSGMRCIGLFHVVLVCVLLHACFCLLFCVCLCFVVVQFLCVGTCCFDLVCVAFLRGMRCIGLFPFVLVCLSSSCPMPLCCSLLL